MTELEAELAQAAADVATPLRMGDGLEPDALERLKQTLRKAAATWAASDVIPKVAASIFVDLAPAIESSSHLYREADQERIRYVADEIADLVRECVRLNEK